MAKASTGERAPPPPKMATLHGKPERMIRWHFWFSLTKLHLHMIGQRMRSWTSLLSVLGVRLPAFIADCRYVIVMTLTC